MPIYKAKTKIYLVSACLIGLATRYDGKSKKCHHCLTLLANSNCSWVPFCPEQLGGLPTPRVAADIVNGDGYDVLAGTAQVVTREGKNVSAKFIRGAELTLELASHFPVNYVFMKGGSPSCGVNKNGVTAALLQSKGYDIVEF